MFVSVASAKAETAKGSHEIAGAEFHPFRDIWRNGLPSAPGQTWISSRYHLHLAAAAAGATGLAVSVSRGYYTTKHRSLIDLGSGWTSFDAEAGGTPDRPTGTGFPPHVLRRCRDLKQSVAEAVYGRQAAEPAQPAPRRLTLRSWRTRSS